jgi:hypothetical protein
MMQVVFLDAVSVDPSCARLATETSTEPPSENDIAEKCHKIQLKTH